MNAHVNGSVHGASKKHVEGDTFNCCGHVAVTSWEIIMALLTAISAVHAELGTCPGPYLVKGLELDACHRECPSMQWV